METEMGLSGFWKSFVKSLEEEIEFDFIFHSLFDINDGSVIMMHEEGRAMARTYWSEKALGVVCFDNLSVVKSFRGRGYGTLLLNAHIKTVKKFGLKSMLWVEIGTWQYDWYKRMGYQDELDYACEVGNVWMSLT